MSSARDKLIESASQLMEVQGYTATGLNQIIKASGTAKGSLYHYFPEGKEQLTEEAIRGASGIISQQIKAILSTNPDTPQAFYEFISALARQVQSSGQRLGGPITIITLETASTSERLNKVCQEIYQNWQNLFAERLIQAGVSSARAQTLAQFVIASIEGGIILSRTRHDASPLLNIAREVENYLSIELTE